MTSALLGQGVELAFRSVLAPFFLAGRWTRAAPPSTPEGVPAARASLALAGKMVLDEAFMLSEVITASIISTRESGRIRAEVAEALALFAEHGWLDAPGGYHLAPPRIGAAEARPARTRGLDFVRLSFESGYEPHAGEPGRTRWLGYEANRTAHAWVLEHPGPPRPWLVCVPAYRMGHPLVDFTGFPVPTIHRRYGANVVIPVLPLHGPRKVGRRSGDGFLTGDYLDTVHCQAQAVWDVRRVLGWLRARGAPAIGVYGLSSGGCTAALVAALEDDLACVIAGMPATCWVSVARRNLPPFLWRFTEWLGVPWDDIEKLVRVISPLAFAPRVPHERRFMFAGTADRLVSPHDVSALWRHWGRPRLAWYDGTHVSFALEATVHALLAEALGASGLIAARGH